MAVEFALLAFPFFLLTFAILETAMIFIGEMALENAVARIGRTVRTGEVAKAQSELAQLKSKLCDVITLPINCDRLNIDLKSYKRFSDIPTTIPVNGGKLDVDSLTYEMGEPDQIMALRVFYEWPIHTDIVRKYLASLRSGNHMLVAVDIFKTEPFQ